VAPQQVEQQTLVAAVEVPTVLRVLAVQVLLFLRYRHTQQQLLVLA